MQKQKTPVKLFIAAFAVIAGLTVFQNLTKKVTASLLVPDNKGVSLLETAGDLLICIFQDGKTCVWDWSTHQKQGEFESASERAVILSSGKLAAVTQTGKKTLIFYSLPSGQKEKELNAGWEDQEVWPRISFDRKAMALIRKSPPDASGQALFEFFGVDCEKDLMGSPVTLSVDANNDALRDYAISSSKVLYIAGSRNEKGRVAAIDLEKGIIWDRVHENAAGFCSIAVMPSGEFLLAGNDNGILYKLDISNGDIAREVALLKPGETRPITTDLSVMNLTFSPDARYYAATIDPKAYLLKADTDEVIHALTPADRLVSKLAFSPDNRFFATSDIRAGFPVRIWKMPQK